MARVAIALLGCACTFPAGAVFTYTGSNGPYGITLQVGSAAAIDEVVFDIRGTNAGLNPAAVTATAQPITVRISPSRPAILFTETRPVTLTVDSSVGLACITAATCGGTVIPFSTISWTSSNATSPDQGDIQDGTFSSTASQTLANFNAARWVLLLFNDTRLMSNTLTFRYANSTVYPAGSYRGTVRFTATMV